MKSMRYFYTREHPFWPTDKSQAVDEISEINDLLSKGGWDKQQRDWLYARRKRLVRFLNDQDYKEHTIKVTKKVMDTQVATGKGDGNK